MSTSPHIDLSAWYLDEASEMGESRLQRAIIELLKACLLQLAADRGWTDYVLDSDQFIAWIESDPQVRVAPDIYLVWNPPANPWVESWQTWRPDHPTPAFALEVVSQDWHKDYVLGPEKYDALGVDELIIFDPRPEARPRHRGVAFQHWTRDKLGIFRKRQVDKDAVWARTFGTHIVRVDTEEGVRLRLAQTLHPLSLIPSPAEIAALDRAEKGRERKEKERERKEKERERKEKERERSQKEWERDQKEREHARAEKERAEKERLLALLAAHGIDPE